MRISRIILYGDAVGYAVSVSRLASFLSDTFGMDVLQRSLYMEDLPDSCRPQSMYRPLSGPGGRSRSIYDGYCILEEIIGRLQNSSGDFHAVLMNAPMGTYDEDTMKYHTRALLMANPCLVSLPGIIWAAARPRDYCVQMMYAYGTGLDTVDIEAKHATRYITASDPRMQSAAEGYLMQAIFYYATGEAFCMDTGCRLYNAHWQEELVRSQTCPGKLCWRHQAILEAGLVIQEG